MTVPGWYPDPGGERDRFRYWDGRSWSSGTSTDPSAAPPVTPGPETLVGGPAPHRRGFLLLIGALVLVVIIAAVVVGVRSSTALTDGGGGGAGRPAPDPCPFPEASAADPSSRSDDGRVHGGRLSYPRLGAPWTAPRVDERIPYGHDVQMQVVVLERTDTLEWYASVLVADLQSGDGFYGPQRGAELMARCVTGLFYGGSEVTRDDLVDQAATVDGRPAWTIESHLRYDVPGIDVKSELMMITVVDTGDGTAALFYGSVPDSAGQLVPTVRRSFSALRVG